MFENMTFKTHKTSLFNNHSLTLCCLSVVALPCTNLRGHHQPTHLFKLSHWTDREKSTDGNLGKVNRGFPGVARASGQVLQVLTHQRVKSRSEGDGRQSVHLGVCLPLCIS